MLNLFPFSTSYSKEKQEKEKDEVDTDAWKRNNSDWHYSNILIENKTQRRLLH